MNTIFDINSEAEFQEACLETFRFQYHNNPIYQQFVDYLKIDPQTIDKVVKIPFLPIEMFKNHKVLDLNSRTDFYFQSSGTTQVVRSKHFIADLKLYENSILKSFEQFIGHPKDFVFLGLLPNYSENPHSSLIYMIDFLMKESNQSENGYFLYNHEDLYRVLSSLSQKKIVLFGVSFALLDFLDFCKECHPEANLNAFQNLTVIETGGMKGRKEEMTKDELLNILKQGFNTSSICSEYSMTELLSQAYSLGDNIYSCPSWMRILIRNTEDPFSYLTDDRTGAINIIDLANRYSCSFIATQDLGKIINGKFQVLGRIDHSDIRGCSQLVS